MNNAPKQPENAPSADGKVILLGEHAVVHGVPALACGLPRAIHLVSATPNSTGLRIHVPAWTLDEDVRSESLVGEALRVLVRERPSASAFDLFFETSLPMGAGLGSSAALAVACVRSLSRLARLGLSDGEVRDVAHRMERVFHGTPSGLDDTVATYGGLCLFRRDAAWRADDPTGEAVTPQARRLSHPGFSLVIADSGVPKSTKDMVAKVCAFAESHPERASAVWEEIAGLVHQAAQAVVAGRGEDLAVAMNRNHALLLDLGLGVPAFETMRSVAFQAGALAGKLTGAGGGGCMIFLAPSKEAAVEQALSNAGFAAFAVFVPPADANDLSFVSVGTTGNPPKKEPTR